ncbi:MAG: phenylalanine--tRNA ligase subunit alpha [Clostridia bacterium]|nr:phenylalanine--tRNA ligase subunit alpha [Clostridia bacterium]
MNDSILQSIKERALHQVSESNDSSTIEKIRVSFLGKKGELTSILRSMKDLPKEERPAFGQKVNMLRETIESALSEKSKTLHKIEQSARLRFEKIDVTEPAAAVPFGSMHPISLVQEELEEIFISLGFNVADGPEIELDHYNFELLNIPKDHPARDMQDSFYFNPNVLLRTHTSPVQARHMTSHKPPIRIVCPGRVYRCDEVDATHSPVFHQMEGLVVDKGIKMSDLKGTLDVFAKKLYGPETKTRFRPSYFPFTEPSAEVDLTCSMCHGKGCRVCKGTGWIEVLGCGMVNPNVLTMCGIDPNEYSGFAFGLGLDRIACIKYGVSDLRLLYENDTRFLSQF